jgi:hypothetical protein
VLLASAVFFKQTLLLAIFIATARYLQVGKRRAALGTLLGTLGMIGLVAVLLNSSSGGGYFRQDFVLLLHVPYSYRAAIRMGLNLVEAPSIFITLSLIIASLISRVKSRSGLEFPARATISRVVKSPRALVYVYLAGATLLAFVTSARSGANVNYYVEAAAVAAIAVALSWDGCAAKSTRSAIHVLGVGLLTLAGGFQLARMGRGEYFRWQSLPYYREIVSTLEQYAPQGSTCFSVYPDLIAAASREYHFGDYVQYVDNRAPELGEFFRRAIETHKYPVMIWSDPNESDVFPEYRLIPMKQPMPAGFYPVYLYVLDPGPSSKKVRAG